MEEVLAVYIERLFCVNYESQAKAVGQKRSPVAVSILTKVEMYQARHDRMNALDCWHLTVVVTVEE